MSVFQVLGDKVKNTIKNNPVIEKGIEGVVEKATEVASASLDPENHPEMDMLFTIGGVIGIGLIMMWCFNTTPSPKDILPAFRTVTINNYYGS